MSEQQPTELKRFAKHKPIDLRRKVKGHEILIQGFLFFCGVLSIFTTLGIIFVLGNESISFFTRDQWVNTNRALLADMVENTIQFPVEAGIEDVEVGNTLRIGQEVMEITAFHNNTVEIESIGTGGGFQQWCDTDENLAEQNINRPQIMNASRPITDSEIVQCAQVNIEPIPFRVGTDALAIVVSADTNFITDVTLDELKLIFGEAENWSDIRPEYPDDPIQLVIPGVDSGTFDYFVEAIFDGDTSQILANDLVTSENDNQLVGSINRDALSIGFFGYAYYLQNADDLHIINIDGIEPSIKTVEDGTYPLARPLFIYSDATIMQNQPQVASFINYYLTHMKDVIVEVGYFEASSTAIEEAQSKLLTTMGESSLPDVAPATVSGHLHMTGSSTVLPLSETIGDLFVTDGFVPNFVVKRGIRGENMVISHEAGITVELNDQPTITEFFTNTSWIPAIGEFGVIPLINSTLMTSAIAMLVSLPLGIGAAIYLSEYASPRVRNTLKPVLEILAGVPTVVYGYFALTFMTPLLRSIFGVDVVNIYNTASAGIVVGILIVPLISSMSEDALHAVPIALREASYGLGATKLETVVKVVIPAALSGMLAAFIVAVSRAIGETMIVAIAAGAGPNFTFSPFDSAETMTGHIARISGGDLSYDSIDYNSIFAIGLTLFVMTFMLNVLSRIVIGRFREAY
jgi:phosphate transport system permease protein